MRLVFTERGDHVGTVELIEGELVGPPAWVRLVQAQMRRYRLDPTAVMGKLGGWSNGYLVATLVTALDDTGPVENRARRVRAEMVDDEPDLSELEAAHQRALDTLMRRWDDIASDQRAQIRRQIADLVDAGDIAGLARLTVDIDQATDALNEAMTALAAIAGAQAVGEGADAGVALTAAAAGALNLDDVARVVADLLAGELTLAAGREAVRVATPDRSGAQVAGDVDTVLRERSTASAEAQLGGALYGAATEARAQTFASGPVGALYASEVLDKNTCARCREVDGRFICNTDDLGPYNRMYSRAGGYRSCAGGIRCRGTVTGVWRPEQAPEDERPGIGVGS